MAAVSRQAALTLTLSRRGRGPHAEPFRTALKTLASPGRRCCDILIEAISTRAIPGRAGGG